MPKENAIRVRTKGRGPRLEIWSGGRWHSIALDKPTQRVNVIKPKVLLAKKSIRRDVERLKTGNTQIGLAPSDKTTISLKTRVTYLIGDATNLEQFELPMGVDGQEKILIVKDFAIGANPKVYMKTKQGAAVWFEASRVGQVLHLFCDGTYWYPINGISTSGTYDPGDWTTS